MFSKEIAPTNVVVSQHLPTNSIRVFCTNNFGLVDERFFPTTEKAVEFVKGNLEAIDTEIERLEKVKEAFDKKAKEIEVLGKKAKK